MPKQSATDFMLGFVQEYLNGDMDRLGFDLDFNHYLIKYYPRMELENPALAEQFAFYVAEEVDQGETLGDRAHKELICKQWEEFRAAALEE